MRKLISTLIISSFVTAGTTSIALAKDELGLSKLTSVQAQHEKELSELRRQKEIIEVRHAQAMLLKECQEAGVDCSSQELTITNQSNDFAGGMNAMPPEIQHFQLQDLMSIPVDNGAGQSTTPQLEAIQNNSALLSMSGNAEWLLPGDSIGAWRLMHIDASKVRLQNTTSQKTKTLVLKW